MTTKEIAEFLSAELVGNPEIEIHSVASIDSAGDGEVTFLSRTEDFESLASAVIVPKNFDRISHSALIKTLDPKLAFTQIANELLPQSWPTGWAKTAILPEGDDVRASYLARLCQSATEPTLESLRSSTQAFGSDIT